MNCVGGSNDGKTFPVRSGLRHGSPVDVPIFRSVMDATIEDMPKAVSRDDYIERYRCFKCRLEKYGDVVCLVTGAWTDEQAFAEILDRAGSGKL